MNAQISTFTVIGVYESNGQLFATHSHGTSGEHAMQLVARKLDDEGIVADFVVAIKGEHFEGQSLFFPGEGLVSGDALLELQEVGDE
ncbi:hypothetical protein PVL96_23335 [Aeromonas hydrophila]|jgi:hypothetical protein|uniref:Uncharacterized protein n=1 Tax=Aeromonas veronii TaxID=654 RepID=A0AAX2UNJ7_AERVE|nr:MULTISPECIES: hypothetical protein [Aeromonas]MDD9227869.1 hypothetical protein [Aeromonas hydrophila]TND51841.1 hypothetical protein CF123_18400 [Aeromonas veronii]